MQRQMINDGSQYERGNLRSAKLRKLTRLMGFSLVVMCLVAIGQERAIAPPIHDGMRAVSDMAMGYINQSEALSSALGDLQKTYAELAGDS